MSERSIKKRLVCIDVDVADVAVDRLDDVQIFFAAKASRTSERNIVSEASGFGTSGSK